MFFYWKFWTKNSNLSPCLQYCNTVYCNMCNISQYIAIHRNVTSVSMICIVSPISCQHTALLVNILDVPILWEPYLEQVDVIMILWVLLVVHAEGSVYVTTQLSEGLTGELRWSTETIPNMAIFDENHTYKVFCREEQQTDTETRLLLTLE